MSDSRTRWADIVNSGADRSDTMFGDAEENANATALEQSFELFSDRWFEIWELTYDFLLDN